MISLCCFFLLLIILSIELYKKNRLHKPFFVALIIGLFGMVLFPPQEMLILSLCLAAFVLIVFKGVWKVESSYLVGAIIVATLATCNTCYPLLFRTREPSPLIKYIELNMPVMIMVIWYFMRSKMSSGSVSIRFSRTHRRRRCDTLS